MNTQQVFSSVWKVTLGQPDSTTPVGLRYRPADESALSALDGPASCPIADSGISGRQTGRGYILEIDLAQDEQVYGFGLQMLSFNQRGLKKTLRVNSDPKSDLGDSHAPVPFYVTTGGYGVLIDTARYLTFYAGVGRRREDHRPGLSAPVDKAALEQYGMKKLKDGPMIIEIPYAAGVDIYIFGGPTMLDAVRRYNLFSGGGCLPARWGLGVWYRCRADFDQTAVEAFAEELRADAIPCDVLGLEPGWQTHSYSCSFVWSDKFPSPAKLVSDLAQKSYRLNLWTHAFTHASSPIYAEMLPLSGDYEVWEGLVPDFTLPEARRLMGQCYERLHIDVGVSGYKLDECDNSDYIVPRWSFPELSQFPSGLDGEQLHSLFGLGYQEAIDTVFRKRNQRAYHGVRSSHALAAPYPFVLYSDLYDHKDFIRALVNSGFSGLLWTPEVRHAESAEELIRRLQTVVLSPQALINAWYIKNPPWKQWDTQQNNADIYADNWTEVETICRDVLKLRMQFIPYLYAAFHNYQATGTPPFRALVMDYTADQNTRKVDDQYLMGDRVMVAPVLAGQTSRDVYLPHGAWYDYWTNERHEGGKVITVPAPLTIIPIFVKADSVLPLATPTLHTNDPLAMELDVRVYGDGSTPAVLFEDDGTTFEYSRGNCNTVHLIWDAVKQQGQLERQGNATGFPLYSVSSWLAD
jgi:alpha-D-xyloside xylohydrolase